MKYWLTPPDVFKVLDDEFHFDFDPCPYPCIRDGTELEWGNSTYCNPPFRKKDAQFGKGPTAFMRKAIEENKRGKTVVVVAPTQSYVNLMLEAGAELRSLGRVRFLDVGTNEPYPSPSPTTAFILRGKMR